MNSTRCPKIQGCVENVAISICARIRVQAKKLQFDQRSKGSHYQVQKVDFCVQHFLTYRGAK